jgi:predicted SnoaL-like aldol condensation-catalyzing enzyme
MHILILFISIIISSYCFAQNTPTEQANIELIKKFYEEAWNNGNYAFADKVFQYPYLRHDMSEEINNDPDTLSQSIIARDVTGMYENFNLQPHLLVAKDDIVTARFTMTGKLKGFNNILAMGKPIKMNGTNIFRIKDGKVVEIWINRDDYSLVEQIGIFRIRFIMGLLAGVTLMGIIWFISSRRRKARLLK